MFRITFLFYFFFFALYQGTAAQFSKDVVRMELQVSLLESITANNDHWFELYVRQMWNATWREGRVPQEIFQLDSLSRWQHKSKEGQNISCAVVLSSGSLLGRHYGKRIDNHTAIWRMNLSPTQGYENDVGSITTHLLNRDYHNHGNKTDWIRVDKPIAKLCSSIIGVSQCTSGMWAVLLSKSFCASIDIYGARTTACDSVHYYPVKSKIYSSISSTSVENAKIFCRNPVDYFRGASGPGGHNFDREYKALQTIAAIDHTVRLIE